METPTPLTVDKALMATRLIWAALLMGQITFLIVVGVLLGTGQGPRNPEMGTIVSYISLGQLVFLVPLGYFVRMQVYKRNWQGNVVTPKGYVTGNVFLFACCEAVAMTGLLALLLSGTPGMAAAPAVLALATLVVNVPTGQAMRDLEARSAGAQL